MIPDSLPSSRVWERLIQENISTSNSIVVLQEQMHSRVSPSHIPNTLTISKINFDKHEYAFEFEFVPIAAGSVGWRA